MAESVQLNHGPQPLVEIMVRLELSPQDLVSASSQHLTFKQVGKACKGRAITRKMQEKVLRALAQCAADESFGLTDLFSYRGRL